MKNYLHDIQIFVMEESAISEKNHDKIMTLINNYYSKIEKKFNKINKNCPVDVDFSNFIHFFTEEATKAFIGNTIIKVFENRESFNYDDVMSSLIDDECMNRLINGRTMVDAFSKTLENMEYKSIYEKENGLKFARALYDIMK